MFKLFCLSFSVCFALVNLKLSIAQDLKLELTSQKETSPKSGRYHRISETEIWNTKETALILCDVWDSHHCKRAVLRVEELVPRLNETISKLRNLGVTVIHAPSDCMESYRDHPGRQRATSAPSASSYPDSISEWCSQIPAEEASTYPIDQSNGGEDDEPEEHRLWSKELESLGRNPRAPWKSQHVGIEIDNSRDYITDQGKEVWNILESKGIKNVLLAGVHTNMCVLGRPFGLRRMVQAGKRTALIADLTDTMYDPNCHPYVSHFTGTDLIVDHIERFVCPTLTSDQLIGGKPFRFAADKRPTIAILMAEDEYKTESTLPAWSISNLGKDFRLRWIFGSDHTRESVPGIEAIRDADLLLVSVRRRPLLSADLQFVRDFEASAKPMLGIRTANHAFSLRKGETKPGVDHWPEFDRAVWGGNYVNHHAKDLVCTVTPALSNSTHPILETWEESPFLSKGSLYVVSPVNQNACVLLMGTVLDKPSEPVAWTFERANGGQSFYTSLGHPDDFAEERFQRFLAAAARWLAQQRH